MSSSTDPLPQPPVYKHPNQLLIVNKAIEIAQEKGTYTLEQAAEIHVNLSQLKQFQIHSPEFINQNVQEKLQLGQLLEEYKNAIEKLRQDNQTMRRRHQEMEKELKISNEKFELEFRKTQSLNDQNKSLTSQVESLENDIVALSQIEEVKPEPKTAKGRGKKKALVTAE